jgi:hypothetical protein
MATPEERSELWQHVCIQPPTTVSAGGFVLLLSLSLVADADQQLMAVLMALLLLTICLNFWRLGRLRSLLRSKPSLVITALSFHTAFDLISATALGWALFWVYGY